MSENQAKNNNERFIEHSWKRRRRVLYITLLFFASTIYYCMQVPKPMETHAIATEFSFIGIIILVLGYMGWAVIDDNNVTRHILSRGRGGFGGNKRRGYSLRSEIDYD